MIIGAIIKEKRLERRMSQQDLAKQLGVEHAIIAHWEHGYCLPSIINCCDLADFFGCSIDELCGRKCS
ncbi:MAG: helix-turn-helix transcriptional regulator [Lachnospiraceae bacterium]|nr:helix-turn-helix transcriptional regulator [Lachnospiraceae bacterium]